MARACLPLLSALLVAVLAACEPGIDDSDALLAQPGPAVHAAQRCPHCGWIESKRHIAPSVADPRSLGIYEYTLRMSDGSSRVFRETLPASWRVGERLTLIDGQDRALD